MKKINDPKKNKSELLIKTIFIVFIIILVDCSNFKESKCKRSANSSLTDMCFLSTSSDGKGGFIISDALLQNCLYFALKKENCKNQNEAPW